MLPSVKVRRVVVSKDRVGNAGRSEYVETIEVNVDVARYDIRNPLSCLRRIYDGIENLRPIDIDAGASKTGVILAKKTAESLMNRNDDLKVTLSANQDASAVESLSLG